MREAVIVEAVRTPIGRRKGSLAEVHPVDLSAHVLNSLLERTGLEPDVVDDVIWGCVTQLGDQSGNVGRFAVLAAGWPDSIPGVTVNRVGAMLTGFFAEGPVTDFPAAMACDTDRYARFHAHMLERGVYLAPSQFEAMMPSLAHTAEQLEMTAAAAREFEG